MPHLAIDPVVAGSAIVMALQVHSISTRFYLSGLSWTLIATHWSGICSSERASIVSPVHGWLLQILCIEPPSVLPS